MKEEIRAFRKHLVGAMLNFRGARLHKKGRYEDAESLYQRALAILEEAVGPKHPDAARSLFNLGILYMSQERYNEAEPLLQRALAIWEETRGPKHPYAVQSLSSLATLYMLNARYTEVRYTKAEPLLQRFLAILEETRGPKHPDVAAVLTTIAGIYCNQGRYTEAEPLHQRALAISEALEPKDPKRAAILINLANFYFDQGREAKAERLLQRTLAVLEETLESTDPGLAINLTNLAQIYHSQGRYKEAEPLLQRALGIFEEAHGPKSLELVLPLNNLSRLYQSQRRYTEAEPLLQRALAISEEADGPNSLLASATLDSLGALYQSQRRYTEAEPLLQRVLAIWEQALGPKHPHIAQPLAYLAELYQDQGRPEAASEMFFKAARVLVQAPLLHFGLICAVAHLSKPLTKIIDDGRFREPDWQPLFDRLSTLLVEALELQPLTALEPTFQRVAEFHARYLGLCLRHGHAEQIPAILGRIHGRRLAAMVWEQLVTDPPEGLTDNDQAYLQARKDLAALALDAQSLIGDGAASSEPSDGIRSGPPARVDNSPETMRLKSEQIIRKVDQLRGMLQTLQATLSARLKPLINVGNLDADALRARLAPGQAALLLVDLQTSETDWQPFALLAHREAGFAQPVPLIDLIALAELFALEATFGGGSVVRLGPTTPVTEVPATSDVVGTNPAAGDGDGRALGVVEQAAHLATCQRLAKHLRDGEPVLKSAAFQAWDSRVGDLLQAVERRQRAQPPNQGADNQLSEGLKNAIQDYAEDLAVSPEETARLMQRYLWDPLYKDLGDHLRGVSRLLWITHGRLHALPFDSGRPAHFPTLEYHPGMLFLRDSPTVPPQSTGSVLMHAYDGADSANPHQAIPFVHSSQAIDEWFLGRLVGTPPERLSHALKNNPQIAQHFAHASFGGHGSNEGALPLRAPAAGEEPDACAVRWQDWIAHNLHAREAELWTCFLGNVHEYRGEPLGWPAALRLSGTTTMVGAIRSISDFWTPLLQILYRQTQFLVAEPKRAPEEALPEAKRRLLTGDWYDADALAPAYRAETTATLIRRFYPLGMRKALEPVLAGQRNVEGCNRILADWPLTEHWRGLVPPAGERTKAARDQLTTFFEALHADAGEKLIADTLTVLTDPAQLAARPEVQTALRRLAIAFVCFGRSDPR